jgi:glutamate-1-semialdehyde 2,1-aminomutase
MQKASGESNLEVIERARKFLPGGVNSPVRAFKAVGGEPISLIRGEGCRVWDADGKEYIDFLASWGPLILGHSHPEVIQEVKKALERGLTFGLTNPYEPLIAESVVRMVPSAQKVRFVNSGTEATMSAVRLARGITGRKLVVKFDGCYHGHYDSLLVSAGSGVATFAIPGTPGIPEEIASLTLVAPFNDTDSLRELFSEHGEEIACVILEPVPGNMGVVPPEEEFLRTVRELTREYGSLLIFDEVITGFRLSKGGAQELFGIEPDITCLGKILGGGMPVGAYAGPSEIMNNVAPEGKVYQAGTLSGNPVAMACGFRTLEILRRDDPYGELDKKGSVLEKGLEEILSEKGIPFTVNRVGSMLTVFFTSEPVRDFGGAKKTDQELFAKFFRSLLDEGVLIPPSAFEAWFISTAHGDEDLAEALSKIRDAVKKI